MFLFIFKSETLVFILPFNVKFCPLDMCWPFITLKLDITDWKVKGGQHRETPRLPETGE